MRSAPRWAEALLSALFVLMIWTPAIGLILGLGSRVDPREKRQPAPFPGRPADWAAVQTYPRALEAWFTDRFALRNELIYGHALLCYFGLGSSPTPRVLAGRDGWLFLDARLEDAHYDTVADYRGTNPLSESRLEWWRWLTQDFRDWCAARDIPFLLVMVPPRMDLHADKLPRWMTRVGPQTTYGQVLGHLRRHASVDILDAQPALESIRAKWQTHFRTDSHWTWPGAFAAYSAIAGRLQQHFPGLQPLTWDDFEMKPRYWTGGDLPSLMALRDAYGETIYEMAPRKPLRHRYTRLGEQLQADAVTEIDDPSLPTAVVYRESYTEFLHPHLSEHFRKVHYAWMNRGMDYGPLRESTPDIVMIITADRSFRRIWTYPLEIQLEAAARRFDRASRVAHLREAATTLTNLVVGCAMNPRREMPLFRLDLDLPSRGRVELTWTSSDANLDTRIARDLDAGSQQITFPIIDPFAAPPYQLTFSRAKTPATLRRLEVRTVER